MGFIVNNPIPRRGRATVDKRNSAKTRPLGVAVAGTAPVAFASISSDCGGRAHGALRQALAFGPPSSSSSDPATMAQM